MAAGRIPTGKEGLATSEPELTALGGMPMILPKERDWQRDRLPENVRQLVIDDERQRDDMCWSVFRE